MIKHQVLILLSALTFAGCGKTPPTGKSVQIQLRRGDALGAAATLPVPPRTSKINGAETELTGKIAKVTEEWVVLDTGDVPPSRIWIPKTSILIIEYRPFQADSGSTVIAATLRLLLKAAWAPIAVLVFHAIVAETGHRQALDFVLHFCGGAAIAYFFFEALREFQEWLGTFTPAGQYLFAFALACMIGVFWELGEHFSDTFLKSHIQKSLAETMSDLLANTTGAISALTVVRLVGWPMRFKKRSRGREGVEGSSL